MRLRGNGYEKELFIERWKMKDTLNRVAQSLTGIPIPVFGKSWTPPESDRLLVSDLILYLEDKRALFNSYSLDCYKYVVSSVIAVRERLTELIQKVNGNNEIEPHLRAMRAACRKFQDRCSQSIQAQKAMGSVEVVDEIYLTALGELRAIFGIHIALLCLKYDLEVKDNLLMLLPYQDVG